MNQAKVITDKEMTRLLAVIANGRHAEQHLFPELRHFVRTECNFPVDAAVR